MCFTTLCRVSEVGVQVTPGSSSPLASTQAFLIQADLPLVLIFFISFFCVSPVSGSFCAVWRHWRRARSRRRCCRGVSECPLAHLVSRVLSFAPPKLSLLSSTRCGKFPTRGQTGRSLISEHVSDCRWLHRRLLTKWTCEQARGKQNTSTRKALTTRCQALSSAVHRKQRKKKRVRGNYWGCKNPNYD